MRRKQISVLIVLVLLLAMPVLAYDDEDYEAEENKTHAELEVGYRSVSTDDSVHQVAEYESVDDDVVIGLRWFTSPYDNVNWGITFQQTDQDFWNGGMSMDLNRRMRVELNVDGMLHRTVHDPVSNLQAVAEIKVNRSTDLDPGAQYRIQRRLYEIHADIITGVDGLSFRAGYRQQTRQGMKQSLTTTHCTSCHTVAQSREISNKLNEATLGVHFTRGIISLDYQLKSMTFDENGQSPDVFYERGLHPASLGPGFNDRLWFQDGFYATNQVPKIDKTSHRFQAAADFERGDALDFTMVQSNTKNKSAMLEWDFTGYRGRYTWKVNKGLKINLSAQHDKIESDPVLVDLVSLNGLTAAGVTTYGGFPDPLTYQEWRRAIEGDPTLTFESFTRQSSYDRTVDRLAADAFWRPRKGTSLRFGARYDNVDRENVVLADGTGETTTTTLKVGWNEKVGKNLRFHNSLTYKTRDNAYASINGALRAFDPVPPQPPTPASPKSPESLQYYQLHALRMADISSVPSGELRFRGTGTWMPSAKTAVNANLRYLDAENDELDYSTLQKENLGVGVNLWMAPGPGYSFMLGFDHLEQETGVMMAIPLMDG